ncbi:extracellular solute-binding protein [Burkholderia cenocepacia]|uniref:Binding protein component of ABC transporter n=1 Tax=Burkholderia cenocepacia (strain ATCC BAA-245 / DSM 16553 / LMG 16656 / NCTC 13227 / J2315 / CF5610) TaxID=216591 RepID=B4E9W4_BURCJ|nr:extracellular solute-binding protein [Burkholderia cenocepacia]KIS46943.1 bacterial extracellular solute-binding s, 5 Middle family protein [Burkholderia cepacia]EPZ86784.1 ABC transporter, substrate-binding protein, family 5 [Burkholderia cenocepacia K56-2Valvano]KKI79027.1 peptide ABC transporter substrate-binding protein [Burkholderia cenocepacia]MDR8068698.1 extracellular solute-binding protein [Burkholderia cenocepacia]NDV75344.1 ABC transporter substrate-binding protein [Burkholderia 
MKLLKWRWAGVPRAALFACAVLLVSGSAMPRAALAVSAIAQYDQPKYLANFTHFDYADPDAPNDGTLNFENYDEAQSYDSLNPFLTRGSPAPDIKNLMFDTLMQRSWDELASEYALIADDVEVAPDGLSATFHINPAARFSNGDAITAADVKYSFDTLTSPQVSPLYNAQFSIIKRAVVVDSHTIRFEFKHAERDAALIAGDLPVFSPKWGQRADGTRPAFDQIANEPPIASGAYLIEQRRNDKQITYVRNPHYWAANLPSRRGMFRFARVSFKLYLDQYTALEAFKAGDVDARMEYSSTQWARKYVGKNFSNGMLKKGEFPDGPAQMQGFLMNLRKPMFQDVRVRHALALAFDFDWMSRMMFYGQYRRTNSFWDASPFAASGMPSAKELALLEPYRSTLPPEVFGPMVKQPSTLPPGSLRANLRQARDLLAQAGWHYRDGALRDANGTPMTIEIIDDQPGMDRLILPYTQALATLGIHAYLHEIDSALYQKRLDNFEYDMTTYIYPPVTIPGAELTRRFGSEAASQPGSENYPGVKSKAVDALIRAALAANTLDDLETATHALDRVLINLYVLVPQYYMPNARIAYKTTLGHPAVVPASYQYEDWIVDYWYGKRPAVQPAPAA